MTTNIQNIAFQNAVQQAFRPIREAPSPIEAAIAAITSPPIVLQGPMFTLKDKNSMIGKLMSFEKEFQKTKPSSPHASYLRKYAQTPVNDLHTLFDSPFEEQVQTIASLSVEQLLTLSSSLLSQESETISKSFHFWNAYLQAGVTLEALRILSEELAQKRALHEPRLHLLQKVMKSREDEIRPIPLFWSHFVNQLAQLNQLLEEFHD